MRWGHEEQDGSDRRYSREILITNGSEERGEASEIK